MLKLYIVRHGKTLFNEKHLIQGCCDSPLTEEGIHQAKKLHNELENIPFNACYVSPMHRAIETATTIIQDRDIPLFINNNLKEFNFGSIEGDGEEKLKSIYPIMQEKKVDGFDGDNMLDFTKRILKGLDEIHQSNSDGNILIVTHSGVITALLSTISNLPKKDIVHIKNCSVTQLEWNYGWKLCN